MLWFGAWCGVAIWATVFLFAGGCEEPTTVTQTVKTEAPSEITVVEVRHQPWPGIVRVQGSLFADEYAVVGAKVAGRVKEIPDDIDLGRRVRRGEVLAHLDEVEFRLKVDEAKAQLAQARAKLGIDPNDPDAKPDRDKAAPVLEAKATLDDAKRQADRARELFEEKLITKEEYEEKLAGHQVADARYRSALNSVDQQIAQLAVFGAQLALAQQQLEDAVIEAPFDGSVQQRHVAPGTFVRVGESIVTLHKIDPLRFRGGVPERDAANVREGQQVWLTITGFKQSVEAKVSRISPTLDTASRTLLVEADVPNPDLPNARERLRSGLFVQAEIITDQRSTALAVPAPAVFDFAGVEKVWIISGDEAKEQPVVTGRRQGDWIEILSGLQTGDQVAANAETTRGGKVTVKSNGEPSSGLSE